MSRRDLASSSRQPLPDDEFFIDSNEPTENADIPQAVSEASSKKRERSRTSEVWAHFSLKQIEVGGKLQERAECKYCKTNYSYNSKGGTGTLKRHMATCVPKHMPERSHQTQLNVGSSAISHFTYNQRKMREGLALYIASSEQPFTFAEDPRLEYFVKTYLQPGFSKITRNTIRSDILKIFNEKKSFLKSEFICHTGAVSLTSDMWTGVNQFGYICVTAHFVDANSWVLIKKIIAFRMLDYPHTGANIYQCLMEILTEYNLVDKCFSITFDNHSANTSAIELFKRSFRPPYEGTLFHIRCACHIINLVVQDGLRIIDNDPDLNFVDKIRSVILFIGSSPSRYQIFRSFCVASHLKPRKFTTDVSTRWNSTYLMLKSCIGYEQVIVDFNAQYGPTNISHQDFQYANLYMNFLEVFYTATNILSGIYYPTTCIALNQLYNMAEAFSECRTFSIYSLVCEKMEQKFRKYWQNIPPIFYLASVMDPRKKLVGTCQLIDGISLALNIEIEENHQTILAKLTRLFNNYQTVHGSTVESTQPTQPTTRFKDASWKLLSRGKEQISGLSLRTELSIYLETEYTSFLTCEEVEAFDILTWWRTHGRSLPVLSIMARDLLTPPVSTVASESCFSAGGRVLSERRSRLKPDILDALICLKDWDDSERRCQDAVDDIAEDFEGLETYDGED